jgi:hypothetical protein
VSVYRDGNSMAEILVLVLATIFFGLLVLFYFHPKQASAGDQKIFDSTTSHPEIKADNQGLPRTILLDPSLLAYVKEAIKNNNNNNDDNNSDSDDNNNDDSNTILQDSLKELLHQANSFITKKPTSVMEKAQSSPSGDKHDYLSLSPYEWPDPSKPNGLPYIGSDGIVNPEVYSIPDKQNLNDMILRVRTLSIAYYFTDDPQYASKAKELLRVWFLNDNTRMNPNLKYAQMVPGKNETFPQGIMDAYGLTDVTDSIRLVQHSPVWNSQDQQGMEIWFSDYLDWLLKSKAGKQESKAPNNHGTGYNAQVSSIAIFLNKTDIAKKIVQKTAHKLIATQIKKDGRQPLELKRTNAWSYSVLNLSGLFKLASIGQNLGVDLWNYKSSH